MTGENPLRAVGGDAKMGRPKLLLHSNAPWAPT